MLKRFFTVFLSLILICGLAACDSSTKKPGYSYSNATAVTETIPLESVAAPFQETILVDNEHCTFTITALDPDNLWGYTMKAFLENKTEQDLMFSLDLVSVNGFMCDPLWASTVTAGMKANEEITFLSEDFQRNGITEVREIAFTLRVYNSNDWEAAHLVDEIFVLYPLGEEAVTPYNRTPVDGELVLFDNEKCTMIITGFDPDNLWGYAVEVYLENKTNKDLMFSISNAAVNGFMCDPFWAETIAPGKRSNSMISWMSTDFEANGITTVELLTLPIQVYDNNDFLAPELVNETFTITP